MLLSKRPEMFLPDQWPSYFSKTKGCHVWDLDNNKLYFSKNGTWQNSGVPTSGSTGTGSAFDLATGVSYSFGASTQDAGTNPVIEFNFGNPSFSISSGNSDANGFGNFEYSVPSGYYALNTSNLNTYG